MKASDAVELLRGVATIINIGKEHHSIRMLNVTPSQHDEIITLIEVQANVVSAAENLLVSAHAILQNIVDTDDDSLNGDREASLLLNCHVAKTLNYRLSVNAVKKALKELEALNADHAQHMQKPRGG